MWSLPISLLVITTILAFPLSRYAAWIMNGKYRAPKFLQWFEARLNSGDQNWKQYAVALLVFNIVLFIYGFAVLWLQGWPGLPLNDLHRSMLGPTTIFNSVISFMTNTNLQHYAGDQNLSNFAQIFFCIANQFLSAAVGFCALSAMIRAFRSDPHVGNFFVDMWRVVVYMFVPAALILAVIFVQQGIPMTLKAANVISTLEPGAMASATSGSQTQQTIVIGPVAAMIPIKMLGTNGGGFYGLNSAVPMENPTAITNWITTFAMMIFPFTLVLMFGRMLGRLRHAVVIFSVMMILMIGTIAWTICFDTLQPNPGLTAHAAAAYRVPDATSSSGRRDVPFPAVAGLPVDQHLGNLEGKEMRFGTSAGATFAAVTVDVTCGAVNCEHDALNPIAAASPMVGMWLNCIYGGKGVGMINLLLFLIIGVFIAGQMVGRTPEYLGKKIGAREVKLCLIALLVHPIMILMPTGLFAATNWGLKATTNPGAHGFSQMLYQFSSASANNGSAFDGLGTNYGMYNNPSSSAATAVPWDIATGLVMLFSRYLPIVAPIAMAGYLGAKKSAPFGLGTLRDDTVTFGVLLMGTILIVGALLFLPVAALGPVAEHFGPIPFGG